MVKWEDAMESRLKFDSDSTCRKVVEKIQKSSLSLQQKSVYIKRLQKIKVEVVIKKLEGLELEEIRKILDQVKEWKNINYH